MVWPRTSESNTKNWWVLTLYCVLIMHNSTGVKKKKKKTMVIWIWALSKILLSQEFWTKLRFILIVVFFLNSCEYPVNFGFSPRRKWWMRPDFSHERTLCRVLTTHAEMEKQHLKQAGVRGHERRDSCRDGSSKVKKRTLENWAFSGLITLHHNT